MNSYLGKLYDKHGKELRLRYTKSINRFSFFLHQVNFARNDVYMRVDYHNSYNGYNDGMYSDKLLMLKAWKAFIEEK